jgi:hypothetical protein
MITCSCGCFEGERLDTVGMFVCRLRGHSIVWRHSSPGEYSITWAVRNKYMKRVESFGMVICSNLRAIFSLFENLVSLSQSCITAHFPLSGFSAFA